MKMCDTVELCLSVCTTGVLCHLQFEGYLLIFIRSQVMYNIIIASVLEFYAQPTLVSSLCIFQVTNPTGATNVESGLQTLETSPSIKRRSMGTPPRMSATPKRRTWPTCLMQAAIQT